MTEDGEGIEPVGTEYPRLGHQEPDRDIDRLTDALLAINRGEEVELWFGVEQHQSIQTVTLQRVERHVSPCDWRLVFLGAPLTQDQDRDDPEGWHRQFITGYIESNDSEDHWPLESAPWHPQHGLDMSDHAHHGWVVGIRGDGFTARPTDD